MVYHISTRSAGHLVNVEGGVSMSETTIPAVKCKLCSNNTFRMGLCVACNIAVRRPSGRSARVMESTKKQLDIIKSRRLNDGWAGTEYR